MKFLLKGLFFVVSLCYLDSQATEPEDNPGYTPPHTITTQELEKEVGKKNMKAVISWAPKLDFIEEDQVLMYAIGYERIRSRIATLKLENKNQEAENLEKLIYPQRKAR